MINIDDERRYGLWWAIDDWLVRTRADYKEVMESEVLFKSLWGMPSEDNKYQYWQVRANQLRSVFKEFVVNDCGFEHPENTIHVSLCGERIYEAFEIVQLKCAANKKDFWVKLRAEEYARLLKQTKVVESGISSN